GLSYVSEPHRRHPAATSTPQQSPALIFSSSSMFLSFSTNFVATLCLPSLPLPPHLSLAAATLSRTSVGDDAANHSPSRATAIAHPLCCPPVSKPPFIAPDQDRQRRPVVAS
ncbi:hypothetical protein GW17_00036419, partial [Ensete ventricosum]